MRTVLVTGASRGIGLGVARRYNALGWRVLATCRAPETASELLKLSGPVVLPLDVTDQRSIARLARRLRDEPIDLLINNAGIDLPPLDFNRAPPVYRLRDWLKLLKTNTIGPYILSSELIENIVISERRTVVFITSRMGSSELNVEGGFYPYRASKAALNNIVRGLHADLGARGVTFIAVSPGRVSTELGGPDADLTVDQCVVKIGDLLDRVSSDDGGKCVDLDGNVLAY